MLTTVFLSKAVPFRVIPPPQALEEETSAAAEIFGDEVDGGGLGGGGYGGKVWAADGTFGGALSSFRGTGPTNWLLASLP
eukprot:SAG22_NODE_110_length_19679_cov_45.046527_17_plen_80_part_00